MSKKWLYFYGISFPAKQLKILFKAEPLGGGRA